MNKKQRNLKEKNVQNSVIYKLVKEVPPISDYASRKDWENICWQKISNSKEFMQLFVTVPERHELVMRLAALKGLISGKSYREISKEFFVSLQTIGVVKKAMSKGGNYQSYAERGKTERKKKIYSSFKQTKKHRGRPVKTKYGTVYLQY